MTTPTTQGATMTPPPCPIAGHDNPHHWHERKQKNKQIWHVDHRDGVPGIVCTEGGGLSRCYSAHVPEPSPDPDEWVRVPVGTKIPKGTVYRYDVVAVVDFRVTLGTYVTRSDLDAILKPTPTPAEKLAAALRASVEAARARQRERDNEPCPKCRGDRLRTDFTGSGRCHAARADA